MSKSSFFTGQPIFSQVLEFLRKGSVDKIASEHESDKWCRHFTTYSHLVSMLYAVFNRCTSLREVTTGLKASEHQLIHLGIREAPKRSTIGDANTRRPEEVFGKIYEHLLNKHRHFLPDSRTGYRNIKRSKLFIVDSTTISLFSDVLGNAGRNPANGKRKGGVKVHTLMRSDEDVPCLIRQTAAAAHDSPFLKAIQLPEGSIIVFDKGYNDYKEYQRFSEHKISWITRIKSTAVYEVTETREVSELQASGGVIRDRLISLGHHHNDNTTFVAARLIDYKDSQSGKEFQFLTNNTKLAPLTIASLYRKRWQIENLFKRLKQNYGLRYFLGDSENAIKSQIWCTLIADLLIKIVKSVAAKTWSFSNLASIVRIHLMTYINLFEFLSNPEQAFNKKKARVEIQPSLFT
jgi:IS4 transposase